jgi:hypothetical protein
MNLKGVLFDRKRGVEAIFIEREFDVEWSESAVSELFGAYTPPSKHAQQGWSAATYRIGTTRGNAGIECLHAAIVESDCADVGELDRTCDWLLERGLAFICYTTWSHRLPTKTPNDLPDCFGPFDCFRIVLPYSRPVSPAEHSALVQGLMGFELPRDPPSYAAQVQGRWVMRANGTERAPKPRGWDPVCVRPSQLYFAPSAHSVLEVHQGASVDVEAVLARPTSPGVTSRRSRPHQPGTPLAAGVLGTVERALRAQDIYLGGEGYTGWRRAVCPSCKDPSPSLTVRANGDGVDLKCHAGCTRKEILSALSLAGVAFAPPSDLQIELEEQLERQAPPEEKLTAEQVGPWLLKQLIEALDAGEPTVIDSPAGSGKSYQSAKAITMRVRKGRRICYATQEHAVAHATRMHLPPEIRARSVHIHSPLIRVGDEPVCSRADELRERVFEFGVSLMGDICPKCPKRMDCRALEAAKDRAQGLADASVVFVSHAGINQVFGVDSDGRVKGADMELIVDEMPGTFEHVGVAPHELELLAAGALMASAEPTVAKVAQEIAAAWLARRAPGRVKFGLNQAGDALELAQEWGRLTLREGAKPRPEEAGLLRAADAVIRLAVHQAAGQTLEGAEDPKRHGVSAMLPDACHTALVARRGVLLSATPLLPALPGFTVRQAHVHDGAPVRRVMVLRGQRGSSALTQNYYDDATGRRARRERQPGEEPGVPWPWVDEALDRALEEADRVQPGSRVLFVTFKAIADLLRECPERLAGGRIVLGHYGALRGKNDWQEGAALECTVVYCFGTPRFAVFPTLTKLGLFGDARDQAWVAYAAGELTQAEGRLRLPRRTRPCTVVIEGDVAPSTWSVDNIDALITTPAHAESASALLEASLLWYSQAELAEHLGVTDRSVRAWRQPGNPPPAERHVERLRELASPSLAQAMGLFVKRGPKRWKACLEGLSWAPLDEDDSPY